MAKNDGGAAEVAANLAEEQKAGGRGAFVDPTPNENYSVAGVTAGKPTPETDASLARKARESLRLGETKFEHETAPAATSSSEPASGEGEKLTGEALDARGAELNIEGFSSMKADEKRDAIAKAEAEASGNGS